MKFKLKAFILVILLVFLAVPIVACSPYDSIKISLSTSISAIDNNDSVTLRRKRADDNNKDANKFTITANVSAKKGVPTSLEVTSSKADVVTILDIDYNEETGKTIVYCEANNAGESQIKFISLGGINKILRVNVNEPLRSITVDPNYRPYVYKGSTLQFDQTKIRYNRDISGELLYGAVEPNVENRKIEYSVRESGVSVTNAGLITVSPSFSKSSFTLYIKAASGANVDELGVTEYAKTINVVTKPVVNLNNFLVESVAGVSNQKPVHQMNLQNNVVQIDLALFRTDYEYKSADISIKDYKIGSSNVPNTSFYVEEVNMHGAATVSGNISLEFNQYNRTKFRITAGERSGVKAYINIYSALEDNSEATKTLIAQITVYVEDMPSNITLHEVEGFYEDAGAIKPSLGETIGKYLAIYNTGVKNIYPQIISGTKIDEDAIVYVEVSQTLMQFINIFGATIDTSKETTSKRTYIITDKNKFGFEIKSNVSLNDINKLSENDKQVLFYAAKKYALPSATEEEYVFKRASKKVVLEPVLTIDEIKLWIDASKNEEGIANVEFIDNSSADLFIKNNAAQNIAVQMPINNNDNNNKYLNEVVVSFVPFLNGQEFNEYAANSFKFICFDSDGNIVPDAIANSIFTISKTNKTITIKPNSSVVGEFILRLDCFGIESATHFIKVNFYAKPYEVYFTLNGERVIQHNLQFGDQLVLTAEANQRVGNVEETLSLANLTVKNLILSEYNGQAVNENTNINTNWFSIVNNKYLQFNSRLADCGTYLFKAVVVDGGNHTYNVNITIVVYKPLDETKVFVNASGNGEDAIISNFNINSLTENFNTTSTTYFANHQSRFYELRLDGIADIESYLSNNAAYVVSYLNGNEIKVGSKTRIEVKPLANKGMQTVKFVIKQVNQRDITIEIKINYLPAEQVTTLSQYNGLKFISKEEGYQLYKTITNGLLADFKVEIDNSITANATDKRIGYFLDAGASKIATVNNNGNISFKTDVNGLNIAGEGYLYVYAFDALNDVLNKNIDENGVITGNLVVEDFNNCSNFIKIKIIVADGSNTSIAIGSESELKNIANTSYNYQLTSNIKLANNVTPIVNFSGKIDGNGYVIYGVTLKSGTKLFASGTVKNMLIYYADGSSEIYLEDGSLASNTLGSVNSILTIKNELDFTQYKPVDLSELFEFRDSSNNILTDATLKYTLTYTNTSSTSTGVVVGNFAVIEYAGSAIVTVEDASGKKETVNVTFNYAGSIPTNAKRSDNALNFKVRKNWGVNLGKVSVESPYRVETSVVSFSGNLNGATLEEVTTLTANGRFNASLAGVYTVSERVILNGFGVICENLITVNVYEGATNVSVNILNGNNNAGVNYPSAQIAPFETLVVKVRVTTDNTESVGLKLVLDETSENYEKFINEFSYSYITETGFDGSNYKEFTYYISIKEEAQAKILGNGIWFKFIVLDNEVEDLNSKIYVSYVKTLPNYIEFYNFKSSNNALTNSELALLGAEYSTNEIEPEFVYNSDSIGGYQTFVFDVFPNYVASENLQITTKSVENLNSHLAPLPQAISGSNAKVDFNSGVSASLTELSNNGVNFDGGILGHKYYVIRVYIPLTRSEGDNIYQTEMGDKYKFTFTVSLGAESYDISRTLEVVYPLYLTGLFVENNSEEKTFTSTDGTNGNLRDEVAIGTNFYMLFNIIDPAAGGSDVSINYSFREHASSFISEKGAEINANDKQLFTFAMSQNSELYVKNVNGDIIINPNYNKLFITFTASKIYNGKTLTSNTLRVEVNPVLYKVKDVEVYKIDESNKDNKTPLSNPKYSELSVKANHTIQLNVIEEHSTNLASDVIKQIEKSVNELNNNLNKTETATTTSYYPYLQYYRNGVVQNLAFSIDNSSNAQNAKNVPNWDTTNYTYKINYLDKNTYPSIVFGLTTTENNTSKLSTDVKLQVDGGVYKIYNENNKELISHEYNKTIDISLYLAHPEDNPYPITNFIELANYVSRTEFDDAFSNTALILTQNFTIDKDAIESAGLNASTATTFAANFASLDGNGHTIYLTEDALEWLVTNYGVSSSNSEEDDGSTINTSSPANVGLFTSIGENTIIKNLTLDFVYSAQTWTFKALANAELATADLNFNFGFLAGTNNGIITNCVVRIGGIVSIYPFAFSKGTQANVTASIGGLVGINNGYITNSTVGGFDYPDPEELEKNNQVIKTETPITTETRFVVGGIYSQNYNDYVSNGNFMVGGFVGKNNGKIASSKFANSNLINGAESQPKILTAGFAVENTGSIKYSYAEGASASGDRSESYIRGNAIVAGFAYSNLGSIGDCYANFTLISSLGVAGFVQTNGIQNDETIKASIESCYTISNIVENNKLGFRPFLGTTVNTAENAQTSNNFGIINNCYYRVFEGSDDTIVINGITKMNINEINDSTNLTGFAFSLNQSADSTEGVWRMRANSPTLVAANTTTFAYRKLEYVVNRGMEDEYYFYSEARGASYGSVNNPVLVYNVETFNQITGKNEATGEYDKNANSYNYRLICDVKFDATTNSIKTTETTFTGKLDGNGMTISNVYINLHEQEESSVGLFANVAGTKVNQKLQKAEVKALDIDVTELYASQVAAVGVVAGIVSDANIYNVNVLSTSGSVVHGKNVVGGIAGLLIGSSQIYNCSTYMDVLSTWSGSDVDIKEINIEGATAELLGSWDINTFDALQAGSSEKVAASTIASRVNNVSYAGGVVGVYAGDAADDFTPMLSVLHSENIKVEGGVVGGAVGGIISDTLATDLQYTTDLTRGKLKGRIAAGGVVGENRGIIMFAVSKHTVEVQAEIDAVDALGNLTNILDVTKYNNSIFDTQKVFAVGGLVGINIGGGISQGYCRININNIRADYAGGIVGISNGTSLSNIYTTAGVYGSKATGGIVGYMPAGTLMLESVVAINLYTPSQQRLISNLGEKGSIVGLVANNDDIEIVYNAGTAGSGISETKTSVITPYFYNFAGDNIGDVISTSEENLPLYAVENNEQIPIINNIEYVLKLDDPNGDVVYRTEEQQGDQVIAKEVKYKLNNSLLILSRDELISKTRKGVFAAFYNDANKIWETYNNAVLNKTGLPKIISYKNYRSTSIEIANVDQLITFINNCNTNNNSRYLRSSVTITGSIDLSRLEGKQQNDLKSARYNSTTLIGGEFNGSISQNENTTLNLGAYTLFETVGSSIFENLNVVAIANTSTSNLNKYGAIARSAGNIIFTNCTLQVSGSTTAQYVGGFVGSATSVSFSDCTLEANITASSAVNFGGLVGSTSTISSLRNINAKFNITASKNNNLQYVGGLVGYVADRMFGASSITVNSGSSIQFNSGTNSNKAYIGGIVGYVNGDGAIDNATVNNLTITSQVPSVEVNVGMIGGNTPHTKYTNCYVVGGTLSINQTGNGYAAGIAVWAMSVKNSYSLASISVSSNNMAKVAGLVGNLATAGSVEESFYSGVIDGKTNTNVAGLVYTNQGIINKCYTNNIRVQELDNKLVGNVSGRTTTGANVSGLVFENSGTLQNSYSTMRIEANQNAYGLVAQNYVETENRINSFGKVVSCYFAGRNMKSGNTLSPTLPNNSGTVTSVVYAKNFGFDGVNTGFAGIGNNISEMLSAKGLDSAVYYTTYNNTATFPLITQSTSSNEFTTYQVLNPDLVPTYINTISEVAQNLEGFYVLNSNVSQLTEETFGKATETETAKTFSGILASSTKQVINIQNVLFDSLDGATIFGLTLQGESIDGYASIAVTAKNSVIANCSLDNATITSVTEADIGGLIKSAENTDFYYSYVGEGVKLGGSEAGNAGNVGGIVENAKNVSFKNCYFAGTIQKAKTMAGFSNTGSNVTIYNCYVSGNLLNVLQPNNIAYAKEYTRSNSTSYTNSYSIAYIQSENTSIKAENISGNYSNDMWLQNEYVNSKGETKKLFPRLNGVGGQEEGTRVNPIKIDSLEELQAIEPNSTKAYILTEDIDSYNMLTYKAEQEFENVNYVTFEPIYNFGGTFYGNGYTINNLFVNNKKAGETTNGINRASSSNYGDALGMFSTTNGACLFDIKLSNAEMYASNVKDGAGFIVGAATGKTYLANCSVDNSMMFAGRYNPITDDNNPELAIETNVNDFIGGAQSNYYNGNSSNTNNKIKVFNNTSDGTLDFGKKGNIKAEEASQSNNVYQIDSAGKFIWWAKNNSDKSAVLTKDIDLLGYSFEEESATGGKVLTSVLNNFSATLDGKGHYITGFTCLTFIENLERNGVVKNLNIFNVSVVTDTSRSAGMIALNNSGSILNCLTSGISGVARSNSGSICSVNNGTITNSFGAGCNTTSTVLQEYPANSN